MTETCSRWTGSTTGWDNSRGYIGLSNTTFGTLTAGRQNAFSNDLASQYDPFGGSYALSALGNSSTFVAGTGDTEMVKYHGSPQGLCARTRFSARTENIANGDMG